MTIGPQFATRNELEQLRRKITPAISGKNLISVNEYDLIAPPIAFLNLTDVPVSYAAAGNWVVRVKSTVDALEFADLKGTTNQVTVTENAADFTLSLPQDIHTGASPTFVTAKLSALTDGYVPYHVSDAAGLANSVIRTDGTLVGVGMLPTVAQLEVNTNQIITSTTAAPYLKLVNLSDTERDPVHQMAVGATPIVKWTWGLDDSDADKWKLANTTSLGAAMVVTYSFGDTLYYTHGADDSIIGVELGDFTTDAIYITGGSGSGNGQFDHPRQIAYDGTYIYVADGSNDRVQKFLASDGSFISKTTDNVSSPWGCVYWNGYIYVSCQSGTYDETIRKFDAQTMVYQSSFGSNGTGNNNFNNVRSMTTDGNYLYICDTGNYRVKKHTLSGTYSAQVGSSGTGNGQFGGSSPCGIATNGTYLYVCDYGNKRVQIFLCSTLAYVSQIAMPDRTGSGAGSPSSVTLNGTYWYVGVNDSPPYNGYFIKYDIATNSLQAYYDCSVGAGGPMDTCWGAIILKNAVSHGDQIIVHEDGRFIDLYPKTRFFDNIRLYEGALETGEYVGLRAPSDVTASYHITLPTAPNAAKATPYASAGATLAWGQNVDTDGTPTFVALNLSATSNQIVLQSAGVTGTITATPASSNKVWTLQNVTGTIYQTGGTDIAVADGGTGKSSFTQYAIPYASAATTIGEIAIGAAGKVLAVNGTANGYEWIAAGGGGAFLSLTDVDEPNYTGHAGHFVVVDGDEDALIFSASSVAAHDILSVTHGDTLASAISVGSMIFGNATPKWAELNAGTEGQILEMGATLPGWGRTITISDSAASGGSNGDIWLEY